MAWSPRPEPRPAWLRAALLASVILSGLLGRAATNIGGAAVFGGVGLAALALLVLPRGARALAALGSALALLGVGVSLEADGMSLAMSVGAALALVLAFFQAAPAAPESQPLGPRPVGRALIVFYSLTDQCHRAVEAVREGLQSTGADVTVARLGVEGSDYRYPFPSYSFLRITWATIIGRRVVLTAPELPEGPFDLVLLVSQTWWMGISQPIDALLDRPAFSACCQGARIAALVICRGLWRRTLHQLTTRGLALGNEVVAGTHVTHEGREPTRFLTMWAYFLFPRLFRSDRAPVHASPLLTRYGIPARSRDRLVAFGRGLGGVER